MNEQLRLQLDRLSNNIESRPRSERILVLGMLLAGMGMAYLTLVFDPLQAEIVSLQGQVDTTTRQIQAQQTAYASMVEASQVDPNRFANNRLLVISRDQVVLDEEIESLAGDMITPNAMTEVLTSVLERQTGLELVRFENVAASPLRVGVTNINELLAETGAVNLDEVTEADVSGQVYEHGLVIKFQGDFFNTLKYLRYFEEITGSFFWDEISFRQLEWPSASVTLEIHTLSTEEGFIGV
ncbi:MAG: hypothetical protein QGG67_14580 [Gammaproteobacteria bacterium]|jgi:MSHA biogenesis protein MshJ|nr:hypothetical protein [Gammaproteobacteria bacterium]MDP6097189.1 hypothetical protein [Gammaproteobacteria bacterium]MDP7455667.1 hypothetical protein [Gammaproteobacteria bacterium]HJO11049.1 hypothetical protein [Gammaproteobacteria bacterium]|tara:strand:- start:667 stop:1386 length:720 start_codon:yes stop_codon:yes gene_type:complete